MTGIDEELGGEVVDPRIAAALRAWTEEAAPITEAEVVGRPVAPPHRSRGLWVAAAAVVVLVLAFGVVALGRRGEVTSTTPPPSAPSGPQGHGTTAPPDTGVPSTTRPVQGPDAAAPPPAYASDAMPNDDPETGAVLDLAWARTTADPMVLVVGFTGATCPYGATIAESPSGVQVAVRARFTTCRDSLAARTLSLPLGEPLGDRPVTTPGQRLVPLVRGEQLARLPEVRSATSATDEWLDGAGTEDQVWRQRWELRREDATGAASSDVTLTQRRGAAPPPSCDIGTPIGEPALTATPVAVDLPAADGGTGTLLDCGGEDALPVVVSWTVGGDTLELRTGAGAVIDGLLTVDQIVGLAAAVRIG